MRVRNLGAALVALSFVVLNLAACGGGSPMGPTPTETQQPTVPTLTVTPAIGPRGPGGPGGMTTFVVTITGFRVGEKIIYHTWYPAYDQPIETTCPGYRWNPKDCEAEEIGPSTITFGGERFTPNGPQVSTQQHREWLPLGTIKVWAVSEDGRATAGPITFTVAP